MSPVAPVFAVVLAAGRSLRFGEAKLMAPLERRPILAHVLDVVTECTRRGFVRAAYIVVREVDEGQGQLGAAAGLGMVEAAESNSVGASLRAGIRRVIQSTPAGSAAILVFLGDQPRVRSEVAAELVRRWRATGARVVRPRYADSLDEPGHPVLIDRSVWPLIAEAVEERDLKDILGMGEVEVVEVTGGNPDIDTPGDLRAFGDGTNS